MNKNDTSRLHTQKHPPCFWFIIFTSFSSFSDQHTGTDTHSHLPKTMQNIMLSWHSVAILLDLTDRVFALNISVNTDLYNNVFSFVKCWMVDCCFVFLCVLVYVFCMLGPTWKQDGSSQGVYPHEYTCATICRVAEDEQIHTLRVLLFSFGIQGLFKNSMPLWKNKTFKMYYFAYVFFFLNYNQGWYPCLQLQRQWKLHHLHVYPHLPFLCRSSLFNIWK